VALELFLPGPSFVEKCIHIKTLSNMRVLGPELMLGPHHKIFRLISPLLTILQ